MIEQTNAQRYANMRVKQEAARWRAKVFAASWGQMVVLAAMQEALFQAWADQQARGWSRADMVTKRHFEAICDALYISPDKKATP